MKEKIKKVWSFFLRFGLSAILLGWLFSRIDYKHTWSAIAGADKGYLVMAFLVFFTTSALILWRWIILLKALNLKFNRLSSAYWFFVGQFFNLFLPTSVGGDVIKALGLASETGHRPKVFASILLDRLIGLLSIILVASVSFFFAHHIVGDDSLMISIGMVAAVTLGTTAVLFSRRIFAFVCKAFSFWPVLKESLLKLHYDLLLMKGRGREFLATLGLSMFSQIILAYSFYLISLGLHQDISFIYFIMFSPLVCIVTSLPSIGGLGVREIGWVYLLSKVGVAQNVALALSLISFAFIIIMGLAGGLWYVAAFSSRRLQHSQTNAQLQSGNA